MGSYSVLKRHEQAHDDAIWSCAWASPNCLITGSLDHSAKVWNLYSAGETRLVNKFVFEGHTLGVVSVDVSQDGKIVATSALDSKIRLFDLDKESEIRTIDPGPIDSWTIKFSPDGKLIATGNNAGKINLFDIESGENKPATQFDAGKFAHSVDFVSI